MSEAAFRAGLQALREGRRDEAVAAFEAVLAETPGHVGARVSLGSALLALGRTDEAEASYRRALEAQPREPTALGNLAVLLQSSERFEEARALAEDALAVEPGHGPALIALGNALADLGRLEDALDAYQRAGDGALSKQAATLGALHRYDEARALHDRAVALRPDDEIARFQRGLLRLQLRDFAGGWDDYEQRWRSASFVVECRGQVPKPLVPRLAIAPTRADLAGQRVLVIGEQGIGDQVMFASALSDLASVAAEVTLVCEARLARLFRAAFPGISVFAPGEAAIETGRIDKVVAIGSLGAAFRRDAADFPARPYLAPRPEVVAHWAERLGPTTGRRIGLSWQGGAAITRRNARSIALEALAPLLALPGCEFVSLQYGDVDAALAPFPAIRRFRREDIDDFEDLAGLVANLDAVVSVQTALVHLAGALGASCLALIPHNPEWRYMAEGEAMPWYGSVRLLRQAEPGAWGPVIDQAAAALR